MSSGTKRNLNEGCSCSCSKCPPEEEYPGSVTPTNKKHRLGPAVTPANTQTSRRPAARNPIVDPATVTKLLKDYLGYDQQQQPNYTPKRGSYLSWDDYFMSIAELAARRSKDPETPSGACLVHNHRVLAVGYSGLPCGASDDFVPWKAVGDQWLHGPEPYRVHAIANAILNRSISNLGSGTVLYTRHFPCHECAKMIAQCADITSVVYALPTTCCGSKDDDSEKASRVVLALAGIHLEQHKADTREVMINFAGVCNLLQPSVAVESDEGTKENSDHHKKHLELLMREANYVPQESYRNTDVLSWDDFFMGMALLTAQRSKDPNTTVGACIVNTRRHVVGLGYNGFPAGCSDDYLPWQRQGPSPLHTKYMYVCHAEVNAILNAQCSLDGATMYVALFPCHSCAKFIIQARIAKVVYASDQYHDTESTRASRILFGMAGVDLQAYQPRQQELTLCLSSNRPLGAY